MFQFEWHKKIITIPFGFGYDLNVNFLYVYG